MGRWSAYLLGLMDEKRNWLDYFYYAAPLWLALETFLWPNFRAGAITGGSAWGNLAFYGVEGALGAALALRLPYARLAALAENAAQLIFVFKFILFGPLDIVQGVVDGAVDGRAAGASYAAALPGAFYSCLHIILRLKSELRRYGGDRAGR